MPGFVHRNSGCPIPTRTSSQKSRELTEPSHEVPSGPPTRTGWTLWSPTPWAQRPLPEPPGLSAKPNLRCLGEGEPGRLLLLAGCDAVTLEGRQRPLLTFLPQARAPGEPTGHDWALGPASGSRQGTGRGGAGQGAGPRLGRGGAEGGLEAPGARRGRHRGGRRPGPRPASRLRAPPRPPPRGPPATAGSGGRRRRPPRPFPPLLPARRPPASRRPQGEGGGRGWRTPGAEAPSGGGRLRRDAGRGGRNDQQVRAVPRPAPGARPRHVGGGRPGLLAAWRAERGRPGGLLRAAPAVASRRRADPLGRPGPGDPSGCSPRPPSARSEPGCLAVRGRRSDGYCRCVRWIISALRASVVSVLSKVSDNKDWLSE